MLRILKIAASFALAIGFAVGFARFQLWDDAARRGASAYRFRARFSAEFQRRFPDRPLVAWLGDSTIDKDGRVPPYTEFVARGLADTVPIETYNRAMPGLDQYNHYMVLGNVLALDPAALFIVANLRLMNPRGAGSPILQHSSMIPPEELFRASLLPWHARAVTVPRLLLARTLNWGWLESRLEFFEGLRDMVRESLYATRPRLSKKDRLWNYSRVIRNFDTPVAPGSPALRMLSASVDMSARRGVPTTVIVAPIPVDQLRSHGKYGSRTRQRIATIREAVERVGGELLDYHAVLAADEFSDRTGHYTLDGVQHLSRLLEPIVRAKLVAGDVEKDVVDQDRNEIL